MKFRAIWLFVLFLIIFPPVLPGKGVAQEKKVYTLAESIAEALANNRTLKATKERIEQAVQVKKQARTEFLPKLSTSYGYVRFDDARMSAPISSGGTVGPGIPLSTEDNFEWKSSVSQPLFAGFAIISSYELAKLGLDRSEAEVELQRLDIALQAKQAYFDILIADKAVEVAEKDVKSRGSNVDVAGSFYKVGMIPINDLLKAEVELANSRQNLVTARNASRLARCAFNRVLSRPINEAVDAEDVLSYDPEEGNFEDYVDRALKNRPEMKLIETGILQAEQEIRLARSDIYPDVALTYDYIKEGDDPDVSGGPFHRSNAWQVTVGLEWTFWEWGKTRYKVKEKESFMRELLNTKTALEDSIRLDIKQALLNIKTAEENIPTTRKAVGQGEENLRVNEERYKARVTTITEVLDAQTLLTQARVNYYTAIYRHQLAKAGLDRALGTY
ncbi:MAG: TolC family protein [Desulfobacterales bacterium]|nr:TolC family protein [Desulfobacterales bacterium]